MPVLVQDPKGYYSVLGISPHADMPAIKTAYRTRAKLLHPDRNPSPRAAAEFQFLNEAYRVLSNPETRARYDHRPPPLAARVSGPGARAAPNPKRRSTAAKAWPPNSTEEPAETTASQAEPYACQVCGRVTDHPRYLILHRVRGRGVRIEQRPIKGVFCRFHGERTAVAASLYCWGLGWWALPWGPIRTVQALWRNFPAGEQPAAENHALLMHQARSFLARGNLPVARTLAEQAKRFARTDEEHQHAARILEALADQPHVRSRDRGGWLGSAALAQLAPLILIALVALYIAGPTRVIGGLLHPMITLFDHSPLDGPAGGSAPRSPVQGPFTGTTHPDATPSTPRGEAPQTPPAAANGSADTASDPVIGRLYAVRPSILPVRSGPGKTYQILTTLSHDTVLMVTELSPDGQWGRILSARGVSGFVPTASLMPALSGTLTR